MDRSRWRKQIGIFDDHDGHEWVNVSSGTGSPHLGCPGQNLKSRKMVVCVCSVPFSVSIHCFCPTLSLPT